MLNHPAILLAFFVTYIIILATPGLDMALIIRTTVSNGKKTGLGAGVGICLGLGVWGIATALGLSTLLATSALAFTILKCVGACYLGWQGVKLLLSSRKKAFLSENSDAITAPPSFFNGIKLGFLCNLLNPKVGIIFISLLPQFIPSGADGTECTLFLTAFQIVIAFLWYVAFVSLISPIKHLISNKKFVRIMDRVTGFVFITPGLKILFTRAPA